MSHALKGGLEQQIGAFERLRRALQLLRRRQHSCLPGRADNHHDQDHECQDAPGHNVLAQRRVGVPENIALGQADHRDQRDTRDRSIGHQPLNALEPHAVIRRVPIAAGGTALHHLEQLRLPHGHPGEGSGRRIGTAACQNDSVAADQRNDAAPAEIKRTEKMLELRYVERACHGAVECAVGFVQPTGKFDRKPPADLSDQRVADVEFVAGAVALKHKRATIRNV